MGASEPYFLFHHPGIHSGETDGPNKPATDGAVEIGNVVLTPNVGPPQSHTPFPQREYLGLLVGQYVRLN